MCVCAARPPLLSRVIIPVPPPPNPSGQLEIRPPLPYDVRLYRHVIYYYHNIWISRRQSLPQINYHRPTMMYVYHHVYFKKCNYRRYQCKKDAFYHSVILYYCITFTYLLRSLHLQPYKSVRRSIYIVYIIYASYQAMIIFKQIMTNSILSQTHKLALAVFYKNLSHQCGILRDYRDILC